MLAEVLTNLRFGSGAVAKEKQCLLDSSFTRVLNLQPLKFLFVQLLADSQPRRDDACQAKGIFPVQVNVDPVGVTLLNYESSYFFHSFGVHGACSCTQRQAAGLQI
jgi:hypothetical protein